MMKYKGYAGNVRVDDEAGVIRGRVIGTRDVITSQGTTVEAARASFVESVDDYLAFGAERGEGPERPFSGKFPVRLDASLHRELSMTAEKSGKSINSLVVEALARTWGLSESK